MKPVTYSRDVAEGKELFESNHVNRVGFYFCVFLMDFQYYWGVLVGFITNKQTKTKTVPN